MNLNKNETKIRYFLVRHGQTDHNKSKILQGHLDIPLNELGHNQASTLGLSIKASLPSIDKIYSSDLIRCRETTSAIISNLELSKEVEYDSRFRERFMGEIQGMSIDQAVAYASSQGKEHYKQFGELPHVFNDRVKALIASLQNNKDKGYKNVIIVTHGGFIRAFLKNLGHQEDDFIVYNTSMTTVEFNYETQEWEVLNVGDTRHLGEGEFKVADYRLR